MSFYDQEQRKNKLKSDRDFRTDFGPLKEINGNVRWSFWPCPENAFSSSKNSLCLSTRKDLLSVFDIAVFGTHETCFELRAHLCLSNTNFTSKFN